MTRSRVRERVRAGMRVTDDVRVRVSTRDLVRDTVGQDPY